MNETQQFNETLDKELARVKGKSSPELAVDEQFWSVVRTAYITEEGFINLNNGGVNPQPLPVRDAVIGNYLFSNKGPTYYMWKVLEKDRENLRQKLAAIINADPEEIAVTRNTTESLDAVINGIGLKDGDEFVVSKFDYPNMIYALRQREIRDKIRLRWIDIDLSEEEPDKVISRYAAAFNERTKAVILPHIINWTGQILPVKEIMSLAKQKGILTILDAAHSFATLDIDIKDLDPDFMGTSLHKWLGAPFGTGLLYIRRNRIRDTFPLFANEAPQSDNIRKFEWQGTRCFPLEFAINEAIDLHNKIGTANKRARLNYLRDYWVDRIKQIPGVTIITPQNPLMASNLVTFSVNQMEPEKIEEKLLEKGITIAAFRWEHLKGIRVTPNVYTTIEELDKFISVFSEMLENTEAV